MGQRPEGMRKGDSFNMQYNGYDVTIEYDVIGGVAVGDPDTHIFRATLDGLDGDGHATFHFWRSDERVARIAAKRAVKDYETIFQRLENLVE